MLEWALKKCPCSLELSRAQGTPGAVWVEGTCHRALQPHPGVAVSWARISKACVYSESEFPLERTANREWFREEECRLTGQESHVKG